MATGANARPSRLRYTSKDALFFSLAVAQVTATPRASRLASKRTNSTGSGLIALKEFEVDKSLVAPKAKSEKPLNCAEVRVPLTELPPAPVSAPPVCAVNIYPDTSEAAIAFSNH